jgi:Predicted bile acid beta-glucosidase
MGMGGLAAMAIPSITSGEKQVKDVSAHTYNSYYSGEHLNRIAFPLGGIGAGMFCVEGSGALSHMSVRNNPDMFLEPALFAAICVKGLKNGAKVLEGKVPGWKKYGTPLSGLGGTVGNTWGLPRMEEARFQARFPFAHMTLKDKDLPLDITLKGWSPFIPTDEDSSSLPVAALEYSFKNTSGRTIDCVFSYNSRNFMAQPDAVNTIEPCANGFTLSSKATANAPEKQGDFAIFTNEPDTVVDHCWFIGGWFDSLTMAWNNIMAGNTEPQPPVEKNAPGASLFVPFQLRPRQQRTIRVFMCWYVPHTKLQIGPTEPDFQHKGHPYHRPWYSSRFKNITELVQFWKDHSAELRQKTQLFTDTFYKSTLPPEVIEAVAANLTILKSPTVLRQYDGRFWCWEGSGDSWGCYHGSCTHVWNYAQAVAHLFPALERSLRHTEFNENQNKEGHQAFRANLPICPVAHNFHAACDGQLGGIMKVYREWRISGDDEWLRSLFPKVKQSLEYCIKTWDPFEKGVIEEPHHNTYDIEFWGPTSMATSFYLGALRAMEKMGAYLKEDTTRYTGLYKKGKAYIESRLFNGTYFFQEIKWKNLKAADPSREELRARYTPVAWSILQKEGPKYQYGQGCLSDGILGAWIARMCGLDDILDPSKTKSHLQAVHRFNFKASLADHSNPQRPTFACGDDGGLILCTWPMGGQLSLPFVYSNEVWTGIEYQVASHLMMMGKVKEGLEIVRTCRKRYDGTVRNPFSEYEAGHWYARALSSYGLLQALTGVRYDAVEKKLYVQSRIGRFVSFLSTATGFGTVTYDGKNARVEVAYGKIDIRAVEIHP